MRWILIALGLLLVLTGMVWILQGTGLFPVGFMANDSRYTLAGVGLVMLAVLLFVLANRRKK